MNQNHHIPLIELCNAIPSLAEYRLNVPVSLSINRGDQLAIVGPNGSGKTLLADIIMGKRTLQAGKRIMNFTDVPETKTHARIKELTFRDTYGGDADKTYYLQQRWNRHEADGTTPTVKQKLIETIRTEGVFHHENPLLNYRNLIGQLRITDLLNREILSLSSGELRKLKLTELFISHPQIVILDNPFIGLDQPTRADLRELLAELSVKMGVQFILLLGRAEEIPSFITRIIELSDKRIISISSQKDYITAPKDTHKHSVSTELADKIMRLPRQLAPITSKEIIRMDDITIRYGDRTILKNFQWVVNKGERWLLRGANGAGKSTLLSLVCADNPQSYACNFSLFGRERGTGESIWDIKKRIGYVSPELHRAYRKNIESIKIVASGLKDSVGLYTKIQAEEMEKCRFWMRVFGLKDKENTPFLKLSSGEQRLILLARAFVKNPDLLILDEPLHGLDDRNRALTISVIEAFCRQKDKTLIMVSHETEGLPACIDHQVTLKRIQETY